MSNSSSTANPRASAGYRPCLRCKPDEVGRDREAVARAVRLIEQAEEPPLLADLAAAVGYAEHHFQRLFTRDMGVSPAAYARAIRARRAEAHLEEDKPVTEAIYDAGYAGAEPLLCRRQGAAGHDPVGLARRRAGRDDPLCDRRQPARPAAGRGDAQGHLPADLRRG